MRTRHDRKRAARRAGEKFERLPGSLRPFKAAMRLMEQMREIVDKGLLPIDRLIELQALPPLVSRGHGGRHRTKNRTAPYLDRSKYNPHALVRLQPREDDTMVRDALAYTDKIAAKTKHDARAV